MKKEYLILTAIILLLSGYLFFHDENTGHYQLPQVEKMASDDIEKLIIENDTGKIRLARKGTGWILEEKGYKADAEALKDMLDALISFKLSALVSQNKDYSRYELDDANKISVTAVKKDNTRFEFTMGKVASTMNHTFVMLKGDPNVYQASGSFRTYFADTADGYRDKKILEFKENDIKKIKISGQGLTRAFQPAPEQKDTADAAKGWHDAEGKPADKQVIADLLSALSGLECDNFLDKGQKQALDNETAPYAVELEGAEAIRLNLFKEPKEENAKGVSSQSEYAFLLSKFNTNDIIANMEKLLGIEPEEGEK